LQPSLQPIAATLAILGHSNVYIVYFTGLVRYMTDTSAAQWRALLHFIRLRLESHALSSPYRLRRSYPSCRCISTVSSAQLQHLCFTTRSLIIKIMTAALTRIVETFQFLAGQKTLSDCQWCRIPGGRLFHAR